MFTLIYCIRIVFVTVSASSVVTLHSLDVFAKVCVMSINLMDNPAAGPTTNRHSREFFPSQMIGKAGKRMAKAVYTYFREPSSFTHLFDLSIKHVMFVVVNKISYWIDLL